MRVWNLKIWTIFYVLESENNFTIPSSIILSGSLNFGLPYAMLWRTDPTILAGPIKYGLQLIPLIDLLISTDIGIIAKNDALHRPLTVKINKANAFKTVPSYVTQNITTTPLALPHYVTLLYALFD